MFAAGAQVERHGRDRFPAAWLPRGAAWCDGGVAWAPAFTTTAAGEAEGHYAVVTERLNCRCPKPRVEDSDGTTGRRT